MTKTALTILQVILDKREIFVKNLGKNWVIMLNWVQMGERLKKVKKIYLVSILILLAILSWWFLFGRKGRLGGQFLTPLMEKILGEGEKSSQPEPGVLGAEEEAFGEKQKTIEKETQRIIEQSTQKVIQESSKILQTSIVTEPIREIREIVKQRMNEMIETIKELPANEIRNVKREVCKQWLEEDQH